MHELNLRTRRFVKGEEECPKRREHTMRAVAIFLALRGCLASPLSGEIHTHTQNGSLHFYPYGR